MELELKSSNFTLWLFIVTRKLFSESLTTNIRSSLFTPVYLDKATAFSNFPNLPSAGSPFSFFTWYPLLKSVLSLDPLTKRTRFEETAPTAKIWRLCSLRSRTRFWKTWIALLMCRVLATRLKAYLYWIVGIATEWKKSRQSGNDQHRLGEIEAHFEAVGKPSIVSISITAQLYHWLASPFIARFLPVKNSKL